MSGKIQDQAMAKAQLSALVYSAFDLFVCHAELAQTAHYLESNARQNLYQCGSSILAVACQLRDQMIFESLTNPAPTPTPEPVIDSRPPEPVTDSRPSVIAYAAKPETSLPPALQSQSEKPFPFLCELLDQLCSAFDRVRSNRTEPAKFEDDEVEGDSKKSEVLVRVFKPKRKQICELADDVSDADRELEEISDEDCYMMG